MKLTSIRALLFSCVAVSVFAGCAPLNDPYDPYYGNPPPPQPYGGGYYGGGPYYGPGPYYGGGSSYSDRRERARLEEERRRLERERQRLEREREQQNTYRPLPPAPRPPVQYERCPAGFSPSEIKCSKEERKHGCQDIRMPSGLGCVRR